MLLDQEVLVWTSACGIAILTLSKPFIWGASLVSDIFLPSFMVTL